jgi:hypothetical protein
MEWVPFFRFEIEIAACPPDSVAVPGIVLSPILKVTVPVGVRGEYLRTKDQGARSGV